MENSLSNSDLDLLEEIFRITNCRSSKIQFRRVFFWHRATLAHQREVLRLPPFDLLELHKLSSIIQGFRTKRFPHSQQEIKTLFSSMEPTSEMTSSTTPYDAKPVLASLRGQNFAIADFNAIFSGWPSKVNPNLEELRQDVTTWLERYGATPSCREVFILVWQD